MLNYPSYALSQKMPTGSTAAAVGQLPSEMATKSSSEAAQRYIIKQFQFFYNKYEVARITHETTGLGA
jgi:hypothetical protein